MSSDSYNNNDELKDYESFLKGKIDMHNRTPHPDIGGFSPEMLFRFLHTEWNSEDSPLTFNKELTVDDFSTAGFYQGMRAMLQMAVDDGGLKATATGNLSRKVVAALMDYFWSEKDKEQYFQIAKKLDEPDLRDLQDARYILMAAGLLTLRKGLFTVPKKQHDLLKPERAGELAERLFICHFTKYQIGYFAWFPDDVLMIQNDAGYVLFTLGNYAHDWLSIDQAPAKLLHPQTRRHLEAVFKTNSYSEVGLALKDLLLMPLKAWGLIEVREQQKDMYFSDWKDVRVTPFYHNWIQFEDPRQPSTPC